MRATTKSPLNLTQFVISRINRKRLKLTTAGNKLKTKLPETVRKSTECIPSLIPKGGIATLALNR
jgi:hypothetical protein